MTRALTNSLRDPFIVIAEIGGHADGAFDDAVIQNYSRECADSFITFLVAEGIDSSRLVAKGYGRSEINYGNATDRATAESTCVVTMRALETL